MLKGTLGHLGKLAATTTLAIAAQGTLANGLSQSNVRDTTTQLSELASLSGASSGSASHDLATLTRDQVEATICRPSGGIEKIAYGDLVCGPDGATDRNMDRLLLLLGGTTLAGVIFANRKHLRKLGILPKPADAETSFLESRIDSKDNEFTGVDEQGGGKVGDYSLSQLDDIGDVDPVAEADVYAAYGRIYSAFQVLSSAIDQPDQIHRLEVIRSKIAECLIRVATNTGNDFNVFLQELKDGTRVRPNNCSEIQSLGWDVFEKCQQKIKEMEQGGGGARQNGGEIKQSVTTNTAIEPVISARDLIGRGKHLDAIDNFRKDVMKVEDIVTLQTYKEDIRREIQERNNLSDEDIQTAKRGTIGVYIRIFYKIVDDRIKQLNTISAAQSSVERIPTEIDIDSIREYFRTGTLPSGMEPTTAERLLLDIHTKIGNSPIITFETDFLRRIDELSKDTIELVPFASIIADKEYFDQAHPLIIQIQEKLGIRSFNKVDIDLTSRFDNSNEESTPVAKSRWWRIKEYLSGIRSKK